MGSAWSFSDFSRNLIKWKRRQPPNPHLSSTHQYFLEVQKYSMWYFSIRWQQSPHLYYHPMRCRLLIYHRDFFLVFCFLSWIFSFIICFDAAFFRVVWKIAKSPMPPDGEMIWLQYLMGSPAMSTRSAAPTTPGAPGLCYCLKDHALEKTSEDE